MNYWHDYKLQHYANLARSIRSNGWLCDVFAIEVGARGFCSRSVLSTLKRLGFSNKLANKTVKDLGSTATKPSFFIWLSRNTSDWSPDLSCLTPIFNSNKYIQNKGKNSQKPSSPTAKKVISAAKVPASLCSPKLPKKKRLKTVGFFNKGLTCYANAILQALSAVPEIWLTCSATSSEESGAFSRLTKSFLLNMSIKERPNRCDPVDPSGFLWALQCQFHSLGHTDFKFNHQHDVVEILRVVLEELVLHSSTRDNILSTKILTSTFCNSCLCSSDIYDDIPILTLPLANSISASIGKFLASETLEGDNSYFCHVCGVKRESIRDTSFVECGEVIIAQIERYSFVNGHTVKDDRFVNLTPPTIRIPHGTDGEISFVKSYDLKAVIHYSGTAASGHYWATIFDKDSGYWLKCDDRSVTKVKQDEINGCYSYVLIYTLNKS